MISYCIQAPPKQKPRTIENSRVTDETIVCGDDEEVRSFWLM